MADIDQIIAGGAGAGTTADFSGIPKMLDYFYKSKDEAAKNDLRDAFKGGLPMKDGQVDWPTVTQKFFSVGAVDQGIAAAGQGLAQQNIQQNREAATYGATGKEPQDIQQPSIKSPPSTSSQRMETVAAPLNKGGVQPQRQGDQPGSIVGLLSAANISDELQGPYINQLSAKFKTDPNATLDPQTSARVQEVIQAAAQRLRAGQQGAPQPAPPQAAQAPMPQGQPAQTQQSPFSNAVAAGLIPAGVDPVRFVAGLKYRAAALPKGPAQESIQSQVNAIDKTTELTSGQRDFAAAQANPKLNEFQNQQEADKASAVARAGNDVKEQQAYIDNGKVAQARLGTLNTISNVIGTDKNLNLGFGSETTLKIKMAAEKLGFDVGDISGSQIIQKLNGVLASESTKSLATRPTQFEFKTFLGNNPGLALDEKGNIRMLGILQQNAKREVELGKLARSNQGNWDNWDNVVEAYDKKNPIKDPTTGNILSNHSIIAPGPGKTATPASAVPKLEVGENHG